MNKQELVNELKSMRPLAWSSCRPCVEQDKVIRLVEQLDEVKKPVVPQYVAEWYEVNKDNFEWGVWNLIVCSQYKQGIDRDEIEDFVNYHVNNPMQVLVNMHQFGYEVQEKIEYVIPIPHFKTTDGQQQFLSCRSEKHMEVFFASKQNTNIKQIFTKNEVENNIPRFWREFAVPVEKYEEW